MCGIAGIIGPQGFGKAGMRRMLDALRHRGPDEEGIYESPAALLGQRRLSIIDLSGGSPADSQRGQSIWIVCNGESTITRNCGRRKAGAPICAE
jgi:asparagine synthase (glutamine-hydrolysing)